MVSAVFDHSGETIALELLTGFKNFVGEPATATLRRSAMDGGFDHTYFHLGDTELWIRRDVARRIVPKRWLLIPRNYSPATTPVRRCLRDKLALTELLFEFREKPNQWRQPWPMQLRPLMQRMRTF